jgi:hypothetical protein
MRKKISQAAVVKALNMPKDNATNFIVTIDGSELRIHGDGDLYVIDGTRRFYHSCTPMSRGVWLYVNGK